MHGNETIRFGLIKEVLPIRVYFNVISRSKSQIRDTVNFLPANVLGRFYR